MTADTADLCLNLFKERAEYGKQNQAANRREFA